MVRIALIFTLLLGANAPAHDSEALAHRLQRFVLSDFTEGHPAALVLRDLASGKTFTFNEAACKTRYSPCSTFKIFNSLAGIEAGVVKADTVFKWDGRKHHFKAWERDHSLVSAYHHSVVWYYQRLAREVGPTKLQGFLEAVDYGNQRIGASVDLFWLDGSLEISPLEQVTFLERLYQDRLPFSAQTMKEVRAIMIDTSEGETVLSGKTGSAWENNVYTHGWYVGHLTHRQGQIVFALHMEEVGGRDARDMLIRMFRALDLMPPQAITPK